MKKYTFIFLSAILLMGCHGTRSIRELPKEEVSPKPNWIEDRPVSSAYYIGIGSASKTLEPINFAESAKNNAFSDLISEISVNVRGESFLQVLDVNYHFEEQFLSTITATSSEYIEGFERMGTWQDDKNYFVYYRLSKATHDRLKKELKEAVLSQAEDLYQMGKEDETQGNVVFAMNNYLQALKTMEIYWNEPNEFLVDGALVHLDNLIYTSIIDITSNLTLDFEPNIVLSSDNQFEQLFSVLIKSNDKNARGVILSYDYDQGKYMRRKEIQTDQNGELMIPIRHPNIKNKDNVLSLEIDLSNMIASELKTGMMAAVIKKINKIQRQVPIQLVMPKVFITSVEKNLDQAMSGKILSDALKNELLKNNFQIVTSELQANYFIELGANTQKMGTSQGFHTSFLNFSLQMTDVQNKNIVFQTTENSIKGLQLNYPAAGIESYKKGAKKIKREIAPQIIESLF